jgi:hypothetical protein
MIRNAILTLLFLSAALPAAAQVRANRALCQRSFSGVRSDLNVLQRGFFGAGIRFDNELTSDPFVDDFEECVIRAFDLYRYLGRPMRTSDGVWTTPTAVEFHHFSRDTLPKFEIVGRLQIPGADGNLPFPDPGCIRADLLDFLPDPYRPYVLERGTDSCTDRRFHLITMISGKAVEIGGEIRVDDPD